MTYITQIFNNTSSLQATSCTHRQNTLHIMSTAFTLCTEAALTPQYSLTHNTLSQIIGRLYPRILNECPQMLLRIEDSAASTRQGLTAVGTPGQQFFCPLHQRLHTSLKRLLGECSITHTFAQRQNMFGKLKTIPLQFVQSYLCVRSTP